jgi:hypothetical protein
MIGSRTQVSSGVSYRHLTNVGRGVAEPRSIAKSFSVSPRLRGYVRHCGISLLPWFLITSAFVLSYQLFRLQQSLAES